jgi:hypothetical protein
MSPSTDKVVVQVDQKSEVTLSLVRTVHAFAVGWTARARIVVRTIESSRSISDHLKGFVSMGGNLDNFLDSTIDLLRDRITFVVVNPSLVAYTNAAIHIIRRRLIDPAFHEPRLRERDYGAAFVCA